MGNVLERKTCMNNKKLMDSSTDGGTLASSGRKSGRGPRSEVRCPDNLQPETWNPPQPGTLFNIQYPIFNVQCSTIGTVRTWGPSVGPGGDRAGKKKTNSQFNHGWTRMDTVRRSRNQRSRPRKTQEATKRGALNGNQQTLRFSLCVFWCFWWP